MNNYTLPALLLPITILVLLVLSTNLHVLIAHQAGRLVQVVKNYRNAQQLDARPVQVVSQPEGETQSPFTAAKIDWSEYAEPACRRTGKVSEETLLFNT